MMYEKWYVTESRSSRGTIVAFYQYKMKADIE